MIMIDSDLQELYTSISLHNEAHMATALTVYWHATCMMMHHHKVFSAREESNQGVVATRLEI